MLRHAANVERYIEVELVVYLYFDIRLGERAESSGCDRKLIASRRQSQHPVRTVRSRNGFLLQIGTHIRGYDTSARNDGLRAVAHYTQNRSGHVRTQKIWADKCYETEQESQNYMFKSILHWAPPVRVACHEMPEAIK